MFTGPLLMHNLATCMERQASVQACSSAFIGSANPPGLQGPYTFIIVKATKSHQ